MTTEHRIGSPGISAPLVAALFFIGSACGQSTSSQIVPTPSVAPVTSAAAVAPTGSPVPAQLLGDWFLSPAAVQDLGWTCRPNPTMANCHWRLTLTATTYDEFLETTSSEQFAAHGSVVVNNNEVDFFKGSWTGPSGGERCAESSDGVGHFTWALSGATLKFTEISDPCPYTLILTEAAWSRAS